MGSRDSLLHPQVLDRAALEDYLQDLDDLAPAIERNIARLTRAPQDRDIVADIFRSLHNLKVYASICQVELAVIIFHPLETLFSRLRAGEIDFSEPLAEIVLLTLDRLELAVEALAGSRPLAHLKLTAL